MYFLHLLNLVNILRSLLLFYEALRMAVLSVSSSFLSPSPTHSPSHNTLNYNFPFSLGFRWEIEILTLLFVLLCDFSQSVRYREREGKGNN